MYSSEATARARMAAAEAAIPSFIPETQSPATTTQPSLPSSLPTNPAPKTHTTKLPSKVYVGHLPYNVAKRELDDLFLSYGKVISIEIKHGGYAFVQFDNRRDADDAVAALNNHLFDGRRLLVEFSNKRDSVGDSCLLCGNEGHWARDCPDSKEKGVDVKSGKCFKCGSFGHLARFCRGPDTKPVSGSTSLGRMVGHTVRSFTGPPDSPERLRYRSRSKSFAWPPSRSPSRSRSPYRRSRSPSPPSYSYSRHHSDPSWYNESRGYRGSPPRHDPSISNTSSNNSSMNGRPTSSGHGHAIGGMVTAMKDSTYDSHRDHLYMQHSPRSNSRSRQYRYDDDDYYYYQSDYRDYPLPPYHRDPYYPEDCDRKGYAIDDGFTSYDDMRDYYMRMSPRAYKQYMASDASRESGGRYMDSAAESQHSDLRLSGSRGGLDPRFLDRLDVQDSMHQDRRLSEERLGDPRSQTSRLQNSRSQPFRPQNSKLQDQRHQDPRLLDQRLSITRVQGSKPHGLRSLDRGSQHSSDTPSLDTRTRYQHRDMDERLLNIKAHPI
ncbi:hypothetical protein BASA61_008692 [Batrachochytrium salamandrivorans]|nr:hypothetical protein BASA61_008692 [Batrachochytrium salamandrivorans]KAH9268297.1 hypothetical protein BASA83_009458 [Batrachochytrium salamandrivorans]